MLNIVGPAEMKAVDQYAINVLGVPGLELMERAAAQAVQAAQTLLSRQEDTVTLLCGTGNNGGDGYAAARLLLAAGHPVRCFLVGSREKLSADAAEMVRRLEAVGCAVEPFAPAAAQAALSGSALVIDALFGTGLNRALTGDARAAVELINASGKAVLACDVASGIHAGTGEVLGAAVRADVTVTFSMAKPGQLLPPGSEYTGQLQIADIGIPQAARDTVTPVGQLTDEAFVRACLPRRKRESHKSDYGRIVLFAGSRGLTGAAALAARAALRSGAGLISLGVPEAVYPILAAKLDEVMVFPLPCDEAGKLSLEAWPEISRRLSGCDAALWGPGLGRSEALDTLTARVLETAKCPLVLDADGINAVSGHRNMLRGTTTVLTPHAGEFVRLSDALNRTDRLAAARELAGQTGSVVVLKGYRTVIASPDGQLRVNATGNPGMATGGSGDALAGILTSFLGQGLSAFDAASTAVWVHGAAGDRAAAEVGEYGMTPSDLIDRIPQLLF